MAYLKADEHALVTAAVAKAEESTSGEIVTVLADRSDGYSDIALAWSAVISFTAMTLFALFPDILLAPLTSISGSWNAEWSTRQLLGIAAALGIVTFTLAWLAQWWEPLKFAMVPGTVKTSRAVDRSVDHFKVGAERRTHGRTGILIYLSMREHRAEIVADEAIADQVAPEVWGEAMAAMLAELKQGRIAEGMVAAVAQVGIVLAEHFPREEDDVNELPDRLIEL